jgi:hypothetical protein
MVLWPFICAYSSVFKPSFRPSGQATSTFRFGAMHGFAPEIRDEILDGGFITG